MPTCSRARAHARRVDGSGRCDRGPGGFLRERGSVARRGSDRPLPGLLSGLTRAAKSGTRRVPHAWCRDSSCSPTAFSRAGCSSSPTPSPWPARRRSGPCRGRGKPPRVRLRSSRLRPARCGSGQPRDGPRARLARHRVNPRTGRRARRLQPRAAVDPATVRQANAQRRRPARADRDRALMNLADLEPGDHRTLVAALKSGRERAAGLRSPRDVEAIAGLLSLTPRGPRCSPGRCSTGVRSAPVSL